MGKEKIIEFIGSNEYFKIVEEISNFLKITWEDERMSKIINLTDDILRYNQIAETPVKELIKKWLDFLNEEEVNNLYNFLNENFLPKVRELWQEKEILTTKEETEETFEEKEKRYIELMKTIIQYPQKTKEKSEKKEETKKEVEEYKTITFEPKEEHKKETKEESLPETTIVITKKKEEEKPPEGEEFLDLSKL
jgi:phosphatidylinositol kinase/protein kinase (PI-3  family)